jgi:hypothetical protein
MFADESGGGTPQLHVTIPGFQGPGEYALQQGPDGKTLLSIQGMGGPAGADSFFSATASPCGVPCVATVLGLEGGESALQHYEVIVTCETVSNGTESSLCVTCALSEPVLHIRAACVGP